MIWEEFVIYRDDTEIRLLVGYDWNRKSAEPLPVDEDTFDNYHLAILEVEVLAWEDQYEGGGRWERGEWPYGEHERCWLIPGLDKGEVACFVDWITQGPDI